jgi:Flp pilus assembly protein TadG
MQRWNTLQRIFSRLSRPARQERGVVLVEFAIVLPVLILIILGIIYFGRYMNYSNQETQLAEQGARWAAVNVDPSTSQTLKQYILAQAAPELQNGSSDVTTPINAWIYYPTGSTTSVRVCVAATVTFPSPLGSPSATIAEAATMRVEQAPPTVWSSSTTGMPSQCPSS